MTGFGSEFLNVAFSFDRCGCVVCLLSSLYSSGLWGPALLMRVYVVSSNTLSKAGKIFQGFEIFRNNDQGLWDLGCLKGDE